MLAYLRLLLAAIAVAYAAILFSTPVRYIASL